MRDDSAVFMGCVFILTGLAGFAWTWSRQRLGRSTHGWPTVRGRVVTSEVRSYRSGEGGGRQPYPSVVYEYEVGGRRFRSKRIHFDELVSSQARVGATVRTYSAGAEVTVYYDPRRPGRSVLEPGAPGACSCSVYGCAFVFLGLFFIIYLGFLKR